MVAGGGSAMGVPNLAAVPSGVIPSSVPGALTGCGACEPWGDAQLLGCRRGSPQNVFQHRGHAAILMLATSCGVVGGVRRANRHLVRAKSSRGVVVRQAVEQALDSSEGLRRASLLRASWFPFPFQRRETAEKPKVTYMDREEQEDDMGISAEEELMVLRQTGPQKVAMLGSRECSFQHQQEIELLSEARVARGDHIYTSGSSGTNSSVIKGALMAQRPHLLTVVLPQSFAKQDREAQALLRKCIDAGVDVQPMPEHDSLPLAEAAQRCNSKVLTQVKRLVAFASHESNVYLSLIDEAKRSGIVSTAFFLD